jgi:DNA mismatch endonuclease (patch repair protein)
MTSVRAKDTDIEQAVRSELHRRGFRFRKHVRDLPGRPDIVFPRARVAVFIDGDFWHGHEFERWRNDVSEFWRKKIEGNAARDARNKTNLEDSGWRVVRVWKHEVKRDLDGCVNLIVNALSERPASGNPSLGSCVGSRSRS